jgi:hypothetical protein
MAVGPPLYTTHWGLLKQPDNQKPPSLAGRHAGRRRLHPNRESQRERRVCIESVIVVALTGNEFRPSKFCEDDRKILEFEARLVTSEFIECSFDVDAFSHEG